MCLIIANPTGINHPSKSDLRNAIRTNDDGAGIMFAEAGELHIVKWLHADASVIHAMLKTLTGIPYVLHFRFATHGSVTLENTHPFDLGNGVGMAHNGCLSEYGQYSEDVSDTRDYATAHLCGLPPDALKHAGLLDLLGLNIGHSKLVFLHSDGTITFANDIYGYWDGGLWYSNSYWRPVTRHAPKSSTLKFPRDTEDSNLRKLAQSWPKVKTSWDTVADDWNDDSEDYDMWFTRRTVDMGQAVG